MLNIKWYKCVLRWILVIFVMVGIFLFSAQPGEVSKRQSDRVADGIEKISKDHEEINENGIVLIRKSAHFSSYLVLGVSVMWAMSSYKIKKSRVLLYSLLICLAYAMSDELHQSFVPERGPRAWDVCIDFSGTFCGCAIMALYYRIKAKKAKEESQK